MGNPIQQGGDEWHTFVIPAKAGIQLDSKKFKSLDARRSLPRTRCGASMTTNGLEIFIRIDAITPIVQD
jgi:hypothetical protein